VLQYCSWDMKQMKGGEQLLLVEDRDNEQMVQENRKRKREAMMLAEIAM
jgi:hypothetical protein